MLRFRWSFDDPSAEVTGLTLGDLEVEGDLGTVTSKGRRPDQSCMVFASIPNALRVVRRFLLNPKEREARYRGLGCNFGFEVRRPRGPRGPIRVTVMGEPVAEVDGKRLAEALIESVRDCLERHPLEPDDVAFEDLLDSRVDFESAMEALAVGREAG